MLYSDWFSDYINWLLNQKQEEGDADDADAYRRLSFDQGKVLVNQVIKNLVLKNKARYQEVIDWTFSSDVKRFVYPRTWAVVDAYCPADDSRFNYIEAATCLTSAIRKGSDNVLINDDIWKKGSVVKFLVTLNPEDIVGDDDNINFPDNNMGLLNLEIMKWVLIQSKQEMSAGFLMAYQDAMSDWLGDIGKTREAKTLKFKRAPLGR